MQFGNTQYYLWNEMLKRNTLQALASENAKAVQNLNPKITVWNTGTQNEQSNPLESLQKLFTFLPPVLTTIADQTNIKIPGISVINKEFPVKK